MTNGWQATWARTPPAADEPRRPSRPSGGFTIPELVGAIAILFILTGCFYASLNNVLRFADACGDETKAVVVLNNTLERAAAAGAASPDGVSRILKDELRKSGLGGTNDVADVCETRDGGGGWVIGLRRGNGKTLAQVEVKP